MLKHKAFQLPTEMLQRVWRREGVGDTKKRTMQQKLREAMQQAGEGEMGWRDIPNNAGLFADWKQASHISSCILKGSE